MTQKRLDLRRAEIAWMPSAMKQNETPHALQIRALRPQTVMLDPHAIARNIEQPGPRNNCRRRDNDIACLVVHKAAL
jgi:hypothetical protein